MYKHASLLSLLLFVSAVLALVIPADTKVTNADLYPALTPTQLTALEGDPIITHTVKFEMHQRQAARDSKPAQDVTLGSITLGLFGNAAPNTVKNFYHLASMTYGYGYQDVLFHRIMKNFMVQGGDFERGDGTGGYSIFEKSKFQDETFAIKHDKLGRLSMANSGPNTNGGQFFITNTEKLTHLDGHHVVFGQVIDGIDVLLTMSSVPTGENSRPLDEVYVGKITPVELQYKPHKLFMPIKDDTKLDLDPQFTEPEAQVLDEPSASYGYFFILLLVVVVFYYYNRWFHKKQAIIDIKDAAYY